ncbi:MAG: T9SS type A sorting domain-containing protein, partial [Flavobacteriales bacterium]|nr:T9SS type A sorting domain-containing protein [Flavobacteriales bacterium]
EYSQSIDVTVNGGGGFYNLYDAATGGTKIKSVTGSSFPITVADVAANDQRTYYVEEPAGQTASVGPTGPYTNGTAGWPFYDPNSVVLDNGVEYDQNWTMQITTYSAITIQSIDFIFGYDSGQDNDNLHVNVYDALGTIVISKDIELSAIDFSTADAGNQFLNTITVDLELPTAGNYEVAFGGTNTLMWMEKDWFSPSPSPTWPYIGEISGANVISMTGTGNTDEDYSWDLTGNVVGMYNWVVSTGTGSSSCGRVPFTVYHDCVGVTSTKEVLTTEFKVYPNPAVNNLNVSFEVSKSIDAKVELINSLGSIVSIKNLGIVSAGNQTVKVPTSGLAEGVYLVKVTTGNAFTTRMITIAK